MFERVKKKIRFFEADTYPLQIRLTAGNRTLYVKSNFFLQVQQFKYQQEAIYNKTKISVDDIIHREEDLMRHILGREREVVSLNQIREEYGFLSKDILNELDENFKKFLVDFFHAENLPAYSLLIKNDGRNYTSSFILNSLEQSLQAPVLEKLLQTAAEQAPPYIPFIKFLKQSSDNALPIFSVYEWQQEETPHRFRLFIETHFPQYVAHHPLEYIEALIAEPHVMHSS
ncbi:MAG: hypothetical protein QM726_11385 [Chitinophagaceae bacterium]